MKIVIDCFKQVKGCGKSIGIYNLTLNLIKNLIEYKKNTTNKQVINAELIILGNSYNRQDFDIYGVKFINIQNYNPLNKANCIIWELFYVSYICKKLGADKVIFPRGFCALVHPIKDIVIIHDLIPFYYNENFPGFLKRIENTYIMARLKKSAQKCNQIITISEASKKDILKYCNVDENKITVIYNGCNEIFWKKEIYHTRTPYICAITSDMPHKNAKGVLESYKKYCEISDNPLNLVVIGIDNTSFYKLSSTVREKIICYKFIKENERLYSIIANSRVFLFLSLIEGFGFPPLEAMQLHVPVICSNRSSLPEVVGKAAELVDPLNYDDIASKLNRLIADNIRRENFIKLGNTNYKRFLWNNISIQYWNTILK